MGGRGNQANYRGEPPPSAESTALPALDGAPVVRQQRSTWIPSKIATGWTVEDLRAHMCDFDPIEGWMAHPALNSALAEFRPEDSGGKTPRTGRADSSRRDNCAYCAYRPTPAANSPEADSAHPDHYLFGTGDGNHSPHGCLRSKNYLAAGGDAKNPTLAPYFKRMLRASPGDRRQ